MGKFQDLINDEKPLLVDFHAVWCGPCKTMAPELKKLAEKEGDKIRVIKVDVDKNPQAASTYQISSVPTLILFQKGKLLWRQSGAMTASQLSGIIKQFTH
jgi:thioredoxin 1